MDVRERWKLDRLAVAEALMEIYGQQELPLGWETVKEDDGDADGGAHGRTGALVG